MSEKKGSSDSESSDSDDILNDDTFSMKKTENTTISSSRGSLVNDSSYSGKHYLSTIDSIMMQDSPRKLMSALLNQREREREIQKESEALKEEVEKYADAGTEGIGGVFAERQVLQEALNERLNKEHISPQNEALQSRKRKAEYLLFDEDKLRGSLAIDAYTGGPFTPTPGRSKGKAEAAVATAARFPSLPLSSLPPRPSDLFIAKEIDRDLILSRSISSLFFSVQREAREIALCFNALLMHAFLNFNQPSVSFTAFESFLHLFFHCYRNSVKCPWFPSYSDFIFIISSFECKLMTTKDKKEAAAPAPASASASSARLSLNTGIVLKKVSNETLFNIHQWKIPQFTLLCHCIALNRIFHPFLPPHCSLNSINERINLAWVLSLTLLDPRFRFASQIIGNTIKLLLEGDEEEERGEERNGNGNDNLVEKCAQMIMKSICNKEIEDEEEEEEEEEEKEKEKTAEECQKEEEERISLTVVALCRHLTSFPHLIISLINLMIESFVENNDQLEKGRKSSVVSPSDASSSPQTHWSIGVLKKSVFWTSDQFPLLSHSLSINNHSFSIAILTLVDQAVSASIPSLYLFPSESRELLKTLSDNCEMHQARLKETPNAHDNLSKLKSLFCSLAVKFSLCQGNMIGSTVSFLSKDKNNRLSLSKDE